MVLANEVNTKLPDYNIRTRDTFAEISVPQSKLKAKYKICCADCEFTAVRYKRSKVIEKPYLYRCPNCKGKLIIETVND